MLKDALEISQARCSFAAVSVHSRLGAKPHWQELGHFLKGLEFRLRKISETDGLQHKRTSDLLGYQIEGSAAPAQNTVENFHSYETLLNGKVNLAFQMGPNLWLFELHSLGGDEYDSRITLTTDFGYKDFDKAYTDVSGWIPRFQRYRVRNLRIANGSLLYDNLTPDPAFKQPDNRTIGV